MSARCVENPVTGERFVFLRTAAETNGEFVRFEFTLRPGGFVPLTHMHPEQEERFEVLEGTPRFRVGRTRREAGPNDVVVVAPGVAHRVRNPGPMTARMIVEFRPALRIDEVLRTFALLPTRARVNRRGLPWNPLRMVTLAHEFRREARPGSVLLRLISVASRPLVPLGRAMGYAPGARRDPSARV